MKFPRTFWVANTIELFERWAWYGFFMLFANYLTKSSDLGGLEFSQSQKGIIMGVGTGVLYFLPVITGAISDRYGYRRILFIAFCVYASAFVLLPQFSSFIGVFLMYLYLALGAALFKPIVSATIAKTTNESNSSIGFGIFYMIVNVGSFIGPMVSLLFKNKGNMLFYISAFIICLNFILLFFYKEPKRDEKVIPEGTLWQSVKEIFRNMSVIFKDTRFLVFLLIVAAFWTMYNQLFFTLPVFITQWVDTSSVYDFFAATMPFFAENYSPKPGVMDAEFIINCDALYIILFQIAVSSIVMRLKPLHAMWTGFLIATIGMALTLFSQNVMFVIVAILVFAIGEMSSSPKITEYIGSIAPDDKKALYMGYSFIPVFIGNVLAGFISGHVYETLSDKVTFAHRYAEEQGITIADGLTQNEYIGTLAIEKGITVKELTDILWETYTPSNICYVILAIGFAATIALYVYDKKMKVNNEQ
ncbi:MAG: MFS transporter [Bacteroidaceae bacterium]|nr:MFS transporter [Bacteroidaceae bacterium]